MQTQSINKATESDSFRDHLGIITDDGKRKNIYPKKPKGRFYNARTIFSVVLLAFMFGMPLIKVGGHSFMMLNIVDRKFIIFGQVFGTHDFFILALGVIAIVVSIILFTAIFGRVFCGWACPQTVFLEMVFRKIEFFIEGDYIRQKNLNTAPWTGSKIFKKLSKWSIFFGLSVLIANTFLAWIIGIDELMHIITDPVSKHMGGFIAMLIFSGIFYFVFAYFREYACIYVCPYGRLQGVLLDKNSTVIAYDYVRGEPRGKIHKGEERTGGDCIDCKECMAVCPTAIDIRNGTQLECVNCTACIDACDNIMDKINKPRGLIRFASENNIRNKTKFRFTAREIAYSLVLLVLLSVLTYLISTRKPIDVTILRAPGMIFQEQPDNKISNLYTMKLTNKTFDEVPVIMKLENINGELKVIGNDIKVGSNDVSETKFLVLLNKDDLKTMNIPLEIGLYKNGERFETRKINFLGPAPQK
ncbi:MAG TPA: cytochrome c oxidase accessory protein CcoG [Ignavibacteria bacterium]|nr:cytochrome c oxidase accessory protein CcoG [Ignavibacteria bacterium]HMQ99079.1 cytochrome c oxidase accessory protein CcoG [Ignavibacteria bacterium]